MVSNWIDEGEFPMVFVIVGVILIVLLALGVLFNPPRSTSTNYVGFRTVSQRFAQQWPAISDEEFLARCKPGTRRETALKVRQIVSEQLGIPYQHVYPEQNFINDLDCN